MITSGDVAMIYLAGAVSGVAAMLYAEGKNTDAVHGLTIAVLLLALVLL
jgi:hypothetical protein